MSQNCVWEPQILENCPIRPRDDVSQSQRNVLYLGTTHHTSRVGVDGSKTIPKNKVLKKWATVDPLELDSRRDYRDRFLIWEF